MVHKIELNEVFVETISIQDPLDINEIKKNENSVWSITLTSNVLLISCKIDACTQCIVFSLNQKLNTQPDLYPVNLKLFARNTSKIPVIGRCSLTFEHRNERFNVSFLLLIQNQNSLSH